MLRNCPTCGRLLGTAQGTPCPTCVAEEEGLVGRIRAFLEAGGPATVASVIAGTDIPAAVIRRLVTSGRISLGAAAPVACAVCGKTVERLQGRLCPTCARRVRAGAEVLRAAANSGRTYHSHRLQDGGASVRRLGGAGGP